MGCLFVRGASGMAEDDKNQQKRNSPKKTAGSSIKYLEKGEWNRLKEVIDDTRDRLMIKLLYSTGCRVGEFTKIKIEDMDFENGYIRIPAEHTKTKVGRTVIVSSKELLSELKGWIKDQRKGPEDYLFHSRKDVKMTPRRVQQLVAMYAAKAGIKCHPHTLRHSHIVHAYQDGVPTPSIQAQVGHKHLATTEIYSKLAPKQVKEAYERAGFE